MRRLEIGPGDAPLDGYETLDAAPGATYQAVWGSERLPIPDATYDEVYASHVIEHVPWYQTQFALQGVYRILKPGGVFELHTINFALLVDAYRRREPLDKWTCHGLNPDLDPIQWIASRLFAYEKPGNAYQWHKALFDQRYLGECLQRVGFVNITDPGPPRGSDHGICNLGLQGQKPYE